MMKYGGWCKSFLDLFPQLHCVRLNKMVSSVSESGTLMMTFHGVTSDVRILESL
jgi:hypothetical protein